MLVLNTADVLELKILVAEIMSVSQKDKILKAFKALDTSKAPIYFRKKHFNDSAEFSDILQRTRLLNPRWFEIFNQASIREEQMWTAVSEGKLVLTVFNLNQSFLSSFNVLHVKNYACSQDQQD